MIGQLEVTQTRFSNHVTWHEYLLPPTRSASLQLLIYYVLALSRQQLRLPLILTLTLTVILILNLTSVRRSFEQQSKIQIRSTKCRKVTWSKCAERISS